MIFVGDGRQADLRKNGLEQFVSILRLMDSYGSVEFGVNDVVRSGIVKDYLIAKEEILSGS
jgi:phosphate starvation-inducible protein PhoH